MALTTSVAMRRKLFLGYYVVLSAYSWHFGLRTACTGYYTALKASGRDTILD